MATHSNVNAHQAPEPAELHRGGARCDTPHRHHELHHGHPLTFSFAAAGWFQMYHFGAAKALQDCGMIRPNVRFSGSSAGAIAAAALVCECDMDELREYALECARTCRSGVRNAFRLRDYVAVGVQKFAVSRIDQNPEVLDRLNRQFEAYATVLPWCVPKALRHFDESEDVKEALVASCCLTPLAGFPFQLRRTREWVCDGGMTAFRPRRGEPNVITISPIYCTLADVRPSKFIPVWWGLYPPPEPEYRELYDIGYNDMVRFLIETQRIAPRAIQHYRPLSETALQRSPGVLAYARDAVTVLFFFCCLRPWAMLFIYGEILCYAVVCVGLGLAHEAKAVLRAALSALTLGRVAAAGGHSRWGDLKLSLRNLVSARTLLHVVLLGERIPINKRRLEKTSRLYRVLSPLLY